MTSTPGAWQALTRELAAWADDHKRAAFWWRDDDAARAGPRLTRLLNLSKSTGVPLGLAVVPAWLRSSLAGRIEQYDTVTILQHGWDHTDHARGHAGKGAWELGAHRGMPVVLADLQVGRDVLKDNFGPRFQPVIVPPWNRIATALLPALSELGYLGLSAFSARDRESSMSGLVINHCHCDPIDWKNGKRFRGTSRTLATLANHLRARRTGRADSDEATGLLTHHLDMDEEAWAFTRRLLEIMAAHPAIRILGPREVFAP